MVPHARIAEVAVGETQRAEEENLEKEVENDGNPAKINRSGGVRREKNRKVVQHHERKRQDARDAHDVQRIGQRNEAPFCGGQFEEIAHNHAEDDEIRQDAQEQRHAIPEQVALESQIEADEQRSRGRQRVMRGNQRIAQGQILETHHAADR